MRVNAFSDRSTDEQSWLASWLVCAVGFSAMLASDLASAVPIDTESFKGVSTWSADGGSATVCDVSYGSGTRFVDSPSDASRDASDGLAHLWGKPDGYSTKEQDEQRARAQFEFVRAAFSASDPNAATDVRPVGQPVAAIGLFVADGIAFGADGAVEGLATLPGSAARRFADADFISNVSMMAVDFVQEWLAEAGLTQDLKAVGQQISLQAALLTPDGPRFAYVSDGPTTQSSGAAVEISTPMGMVARAVSGLVGLGMIAALGFLVMRRR